MSAFGIDIYPTGTRRQINVDFTLITRRDVVDLVNNVESTLLVLSGTLNSSIPYHTIDVVVATNVDSTYVLSTVSTPFIDCCISANDL